MKRIFIAAPLFTLLASPAAAYVADGHSWQLSCNANGYVLQSDYPVSRILGFGADARQSDEREKLTLGKSCDALHSVLGKGKWCFSNGGFEARFEEHNIAFGYKQELWCETGIDPEADCLCMD